MNLAGEYANKALEKDEYNSLGNSILGQFHLLNGKHEEAIVASQRSAEFRPVCSGPHSFLAYTHNFSGDPEKAIDSAKFAIRLNPLAPVWFLSILATAYFLCGRHEEAVGAAKEAVARNEKNIPSRLILICSLLDLGREKAAEGVAKEVLKINPKFSLDRHAKTQPYKDSSILNQQIEHLRRAGLPE